MLEMYQNKIQTLDNLDLKNKKVLCRLDLNVPLNDDLTVADDTRIQASYKTIKHCLDKGAQLTIISHLGRPKGKAQKKFSLLPVAEYMAEAFDLEFIFADDCVGDGVKKVLSQRHKNQVVFLENLRFHSLEKNNDMQFAKGLQSNHDIYINDAFGVLHREHASVVALARLFRFEDKAVGFLIENELQSMQTLTHDVQKPFAVILGGAKISDKIKLLQELMPKIDALYLGGAMVFTFLKAMGKSIGNSMYEKDMLDYAKKILQLSDQHHVSVFFPKDFQIAKSAQDLDSLKYHFGDAIPEDWVGFDVGPKTVEFYEKHLQSCQTVFWNGPMGWFEQKPFDEGSVKLSAVLAESEAQVFVGGGDSAACVKQADFAQDMTHISTGGGATLALLEGKRLPGLLSLGESLRA